MHPRQLVETCDARDSGWGARVTAGAPHTHVVLLVEDYDDFREALTLLIEDLGPRVVTARNGRDALEQLCAGLRPCLILLDMMMPVMDGISFRRAQLADARLARIPVVMISVTGLQYEDEARDLGIETFLRKPFPPEELASLLAHHCGSVA